ncbi:MAG: LacI family DNA-binding transcriptional regulator [Actinomycetaceae bacterium]|nr:LacI family DNA-binding transcriptional regulator [Actinomycetaceae bacterium]
MARAVTQSDVAREAGVSRQLVSLVIQNDSRVSPARRAAVLAAIEKLGYLPNAAAQSLASQSTQNLGLILPSLDNAFYGEFAEAFTKAAYVRGLTTLHMVSFRDPALERRAIERMCEMRVDGIALISPLIEPDDLQTLGEQVRVCLVSNNDAPASVDYVHTNDFRAIQMATEHLIEQGYTDVVYLGYARHIAGDTSYERIRGYRETMAKLGRESEIAVFIMEDGDSDPIGEIIDEYGANTGVVAYNDSVASELIFRLHQADLMPGRDVGVTGFDNTALARTATLNITSIDHRLEDMAQAALAQLTDRTRTVRRHQTRIETEPILIVRQSSCRL